MINKLYFYILIFIYLCKVDPSGQEGEIKWNYFNHLYEADISDPALARMCPRITIRHIKLDNTAKMRVRFATQVKYKYIFPTQDWNKPFFMPECRVENTDVKTGRKVVFLSFLYNILFLKIFMASLCLKSYSFLHRFSVYQWLIVYICIYHIRCLNSKVVKPQSPSASG